MLNATEICNIALSHLAKGRILSIDEQSEQARQCKLFYDYTRQALLREYNWGFAKKLVKLAEVRTEDPRWDYVYQYPQQCIQVRRIFNVMTANDIFDNPKVVERKNVCDRDRHKYEVYMVSDNVRGIGCDVSQAWCEYTFDAIDTEQFPSDFVEAFTHLLASNMAMQLTGNMQIQNSEFQHAQAIINKAVYTTASEQYEKPEAPKKYFDGRR